MKNILNTIGNTPLIAIKNCTHGTSGRILFKYEKDNPGGSIKDRPAIFIIEEAERRGLLKPGGTIIESSSGNFGISLAMIGAVKGYHVMILVDPKTTNANLALLKGFGAEVIVVNEQDDSGSYHKTRIFLANKLASEIENSFRPDQCFNLLNSKAHYKTTAQEIAKDCKNKISVFIAPISTGGQLGGISRYLKKHIPDIKIIGVDASGSTIFGGTAHPYKIPGIGLGWTPNNLRLEFVDYVYKITDEQAFVTARAIAKNEGILIGPSSGACALVALNMAEKTTKKDNIVCMISDGGDRYIQTLFNDEWMTLQGFSLDYDIKNLYAMASQIQPWSISPCDCANYRPDLLNSLNIPNSTVEINSEIINYIYD
jgi:cystathionine beta-synthase/cysteine synthase A